MRSSTASNNRSKRVTIRDVAVASGTSVATVSRVVNNAGDVTPELEQTVRAAIQKLHYIPNRAARSLVKQKTYNIGIIVNNLHDPFFYDLIRGFEDGSIETKYDVMFCSVVNDDPVTKERYVRHLSSGLVDAIVLYGSYRTDVRALEYLVNNPLVDLTMIENDIPEIACNKLLVDNIGGARQATEYLISMGHRKIAYISGNPNKKVTMDRLNGYVQTMQQHGLVVHDDYIQHASNNGAGYSCMNNILRSEQPPTAIFCWDDGVASYAVKACIDAGLKVPEDISVIGFDSRTILPEDYSGPRITSIEQPLYQIGKESIELISERLSKSGYGEPVRRIYPTRVVEKETVRRYGL